MDKSELIGAIIMAICCFGCGMLFFGIGVRADKSTKPVNFWAGKEVDPTKVSELSGYNHACAVMWKRYSVPYWLAGVFSCMNALGSGYMIAAAILLFVACFPGIILLIRQYRQIEKKYIL